MKIYNLFFLTFICTATHTVLLAQNDNDGMYITEARLAIEKYKDYDSGIKSLNKLSAEGKKNPIYSLYMAKAHEGKKDDEKTLYYYQQYANQTSVTPELMEKIADLRYKQGKIEENDIAGTWVVTKISGFDKINKPILIKDANSNTITELSDANVEIKKETNTSFKVILNKKILLVTFYLDTKSYEFYGKDDILYWEYWKEHTDEKIILTNIPYFSEKTFKDNYKLTKLDGYLEISIPVIEIPDKDNRKSYNIHIYLKKN